MTAQIHREITPLNNNDCFLVFDRQRIGFNFPIHFHPEFEINFIQNAAGAKRVVGDHISKIGDRELVLVGPNLYHGWENSQNSMSETMHEITIQFPPDLFSESYLNKNILKPVQELLKHAYRGVSFSEDTIKVVESKLLSLSSKRGFDSFLEFQSILYDLAVSRGQKTLTNISFSTKDSFANSEKIKKVYNYIQANYSKKIKVEEVAELVDLSVVSFSRLIKQRTGKTFVDFVNELRLGYATRLLIESNKTVTEICYECGFNNISNFNRIFKKSQGRTPSEFRESYSGTKKVI
ncbi:AraC family transcriptional regulator [Mangrovibacterium diazotrophicum]|uniref:AraC family transcriptional regulator n=1 Tax=Mangrovibacterium diazotrophicum TaxID=1261403 RepID=A0A419W5A7_9BACT|nr:AraC family transcriptional regulator [Mangrovibacterium diazotrophicum]RKD90649.1 AraC family transcriptional regulator [Mangrovibacterium diazotrophicum]